MELGQLPAFLRFFYLISFQQKNLLNIVKIFKWIKILAWNILLKFSGNHDAFSPGKLPEAICALLLSFIMLLEYTEKDILTVE